MPDFINFTVHWTDIWPCVVARKVICLLSGARLVVLVWSYSFGRTRLAVLPTG